MSAFKSAATDYESLRQRREELFGAPWHGTETGTENGVDVARPAPASARAGSAGETPRADPGHYSGY
jgi:hypothetical protein